MSLHRTTKLSSSDTKRCGLGAVIDNEEKGNEIGERMVEAFKKDGNLKAFAMGTCVGFLFLKTGHVCLVVFDQVREGAEGLYVLENCILG
ncbi:hypothetical protein Leryth_020711 [Lithospermum erythrorhizon]|nr:hypothetical protein Leryth_020711 [Lithospermum erythrorhizon]